MRHDAYRAVNFAWTVFSRRPDTTNSVGDLPNAYPHTLVSRPYDLPRRESSTKATNRLRLFRATTLRFELFRSVEKEESKRPRAYRQRNKTIRRNKRISLFDRFPINSQHRRWERERCNKKKKKGKGETRIITGEKRATLFAEREKRKERKKIRRVPDVCVCVWIIVISMGIV